MNGKIVGTVLIGLAVIAGAALYYLQVYHFYDEVAYGTSGGVVVTRVDGEPGEIAVRDVSAIDANSSPIRFRACFVTDVPVEEMISDFQTYPDAEPLNAPGWFTCFDAVDLGAARDRVLVFLEHHADRGSGHRLPRGRTHRVWD